MKAKKQSLASKKKQETASQFGFITPRFAVVALIFIFVALASVSCELKLGDFISPKNVTGFDLSTAGSPGNASPEASACSVNYACAENATGQIADESDPVPSYSSPDQPGDVLVQPNAAEVNPRPVPNITAPSKSAAVAKGNAAMLSQVEFYLLVNGKGYLRHVLSEKEVGSYNFSGLIVTVQPAIITNTYALFKIGDGAINYTTKAIAEGKSDVQGDIELFVANIYYRR